jgi:hypothetical protein
VHGVYQHYADLYLLDLKCNIIATRFPSVFVFRVVINVHLLLVVVLADDSWSTLCTYQLITFDNNALIRYNIPLNTCHLCVHACLHVFGWHKY